MQDTDRPYHRRSRRIGMSLPVRFLPSVPRGDLLEEIATTRNVSRERIYFLTRREHYQKGCACWSRCPITRSVIAVIVITLPKLFASSCSKMVNGGSLFNSCNRSRISLFDIPMRFRPGFSGEIQDRQRLRCVTPSPMTYHKSAGPKLAASFPWSRSSSTTDL